MGRAVHGDQISGSCSTCRQSRRVGGILCQFMRLRPNALLLPGRQYSMVPRTVYKATHCRTLNAVRIGWINASSTASVLFCFRSERVIRRPLNLMPSLLSLARITIITRTVGRRCVVHFSLPQPSYDHFGSFCLYTLVWMHFITRILTINV